MATPDGCLDDTVGNYEATAPRSNGIVRPCCRCVESKLAVIRFRLRSRPFEAIIDEMIRCWSVTLPSISVRLMSGLVSTYTRAPLH